MKNPGIEFYRKLVLESKNGKLAQSFMEAKSESAWVQQKANRLSYHPLNADNFETLSLEHNDTKYSLS